MCLTLPLLSPNVMTFIMSPFLYLRRFYPLPVVISHVLLVAMPIPLAAQWYERNPFGFMFYAMARPSLRERILYFKQLFAPRCTTGPSIDHKAYSTLTEFILLKRNVKSSFSSCISLVWKECCLWIFNKGKPPTLMPFFWLKFRAAHHSSRPRTGSNRHSRICSPIHFHYVT